MLQQGFIQYGMDEDRRRHLRLQGQQLRRRLTGVGHNNIRTLARAPARHGQTRGAKPQDENVLVRQLVHRSFKVESPTRHSSMVMIQKRTTTCVSFQPLFSKW